MNGQKFRSLGIVSSSLLRTVKEKNSIILRGASRGRCRVPVLGETETSVNNVVWLDRCFFPAASRADFMYRIDVWDASTSWASHLQDKPHHPWNALFPPMECNIHYCWTYEMQAVSDHWSCIDACNESCRWGLKWLLWYKMGCRTHGSASFNE